MAGHHLWSGFTVMTIVGWSLPTVGTAPGSNPSREFDLQRGDELLGDLFETVRIRVQLIGPVCRGEHGLGIDHREIVGSVSCEPEQQVLEVR